MSREPQRADDMKVRPPSSVALAAAVVGIVSLVVFPLAPVAIVLAIVVLARGHEGREMAIVGLLAGILGLIIVPSVLYGLMPAFERAQHQGQVTSCQSNLKQVGLAQLMYAQDYDEHFCPAAEWPEQLHPYVYNQQIYICPDDSSKHRSFIYGYPISYTMNDAMDRRDLSTVASPATEVLVFDGDTVMGGQGEADFRHSGAVNVGYVDGHVKQVQKSDWPTLWPTKAPSAGGSAGEEAAEDGNEEAQEAPTNEAGAQGPGP